MVNLNPITNAVVTKGEQLVHTIASPNEILKLTHLEGAKFQDVLNGLKNEFPNLEFLKKHGIVKIQELPSGNKVIKINTNRWRGSEKEVPVDAYKKIQLYFNENGDCLQLTSVSGTPHGFDYGGNVIRTAQGKEHLQKAGCMNPTTYESTTMFNSFGGHRRFRYQSNEAGPNGTANTIEYPNWNGKNCVSSESNVYSKPIITKDNKLEFIPYKVDKIK